MNTERWDELNLIFKDTGLKGATDKRQVEKSLANLLSNKKIFFWLFGLLFSSVFFKAIRSIVFDNESELRIKAIDYLSNFEGENVIQALQEAIDDTDKKVREIAENLLREKLGDEKANEFLEEEQSKLDGLKNSASEAKEKLKDIIKKFPGLKTVTSLFDGALETLSNAKGAATEGIKEGFSSMKNKFSWKRENKMQD